jgi:hypothetical protein
MSAHEPDLPDLFLQSVVDVCQLLWSAFIHIHTLPNTCIDSLCVVTSECVPAISKSSDQSCQWSSFKCRQSPYCAVKHRNKLLLLHTLDAECKLIWSVKSTLHMCSLKQILTRKSIKWPIPQPRIIHLDKIPYTSK